MIGERLPSNIIKFPRRHQNPILRSLTEIGIILGIATVAGGTAMFVNENMHNNTEAKITQYTTQTTHPAEFYLASTALEDQKISPSAESFGLIIVGSTTLLVSLCAKAYSKNFRD